MSDADYARVVEDLKRSKAHMGNGDMADEQKNAAFFIDALGFYAGITAVDPDPQTRERGKALAARCKALTVGQMTDCLADTAHRLAMQYRNSNHPAKVYARALAEIEVELCIAEQRPR